MDDNLVEDVFEGINGARGEIFLALDFNAKLGIEEGLVEFAFFYYVLRPLFEGDFVVLHVENTEVEGTFVELRIDIADNDFEGHAVEVLDGTHLSDDVVGDL